VGVGVERRRGDRLGSVARLRERTAELTADS